MACCWSEERGLSRVRSSKGGAHLDEEAEVAGPYHLEEGHVAVAQILDVLVLLGERLVAPERDIGPRLTFVEVLDGLDAGVDAIEPEGRAELEDEAVEVVEGEGGRLVEPSQDLVGAVAVGVVVRVPLQLEGDGGGPLVPGVVLVDGLVVAILVLLPLQAVVLQVVDALEEEHAEEGVNQLVLQGGPAQGQVDGAQDGGVKQEAKGQLVLENLLGQRGLHPLVPPHHALYLALVGLHVRADRGADDEVEDVLVEIGGGGVLGRGHVLVVALDMLVQEVGVEEHGVGESAHHLVDELTLMHELVACRNGVGQREGEVEGEAEVLRLRLRLVPEEEAVRVVHALAHERELPDPGGGVEAHVEVEGRQESLIFGEGGLAPFRQILVVLRAQQVGERAPHVHVPEGRQDVPSVEVDEVVDD
mmetsp:Transcript_2679/g.4512  ORF Transcript_2679/g.4512 Transcript_2679/m.4512 type:complete len:417 (-) Transcript_2679:290-1540(-)